MNGWRVDPAKLKVLREEAQWTPAQISAAVGCHRTSWYRYELGSQPNGTVAMATLIALSVRLGRKVRISEIADPASESDVAA